MSKSRQRTEFGDFQTPAALAQAVCRFLSRRGVQPGSIVEPTCGLGALLLAALDAFPGAQLALGADINPSYVECLNRTLNGDRRCSVMQSDFFGEDWGVLLKGLPDPLLVIGNPPWVTNSTLGGLSSQNLPAKSNFQNRAGIEAITGKSNFDISEWMLLKMVEWFRGRRGTLAMLCKTAVARKILSRCWKLRESLSSACVVRIDADAQFGAAVDACLLVCDFGGTGRAESATVYAHLDEQQSAQSWGWWQGTLLADSAALQRNCDLATTLPNRRYVWRSGIKHDCAKVMEFRESHGRLINGDGQIVDLESSCLFPMLKSSDVAQGRVERPRHWMLVPQRTVSFETETLRETAPQTWSYLNGHAPALDRRKSSIYRNRARFAVFGVGDYTFAPYKVAISGFYKRLAFRVVPPYAECPVVFDDTVYFLACRSREEAVRLASLLNSEVAQDFFSAFVFWDAKRPITAEILSRLDLSALARRFGCEEELHRVGELGDASSPQLQLFVK